MMCAYSDKTREGGGRGGGGGSKQEAQAGNSCTYSAVASMFKLQEIPLIPAAADS